MPAARTKGELLAELMVLKNELNAELAKSKDTIDRIQAKLALFRNEIRNMGIPIPADKPPVVTLETLDPYADLTPEQEEHILESALEDWRNERAKTDDQEP